MDSFVNAIRDILGERQDDSPSFNNFAVTYGYAVSSTEASSLNSYTTESSSTEVYGETSVASTFVSSTTSITPEASVTGAQTTPPVLFDSRTTSTASSTSSLGSDNSSPAYSISTSPYVNTQTLNPSQFSATSSGQSDNTSFSSAGLISAAVIGTIVSIGIIAGAWFCIRRRRRRLAYDRKYSRPATSQSGYINPSQQTQRSTEIHGGDLTTAEVAQVLPFPSRMLRPNHARTYATQPSEPSYAGSATDAGRESTAWTDDTEFDMLAVDGSSIARTLSTTSTRRQSLLSDDEGREASNPFAHPGYTLAPRAAPRLMVDVKSAQGTTLPFTGTSSSSRSGYPSLSRSGTTSQSRSSSSHGHATSTYNRGTTSTPSATYDHSTSTHAPNILTPLSATYDRNPFSDPVTIVSPISPFNAHPSSTFSQPTHTFPEQALTSSQYQLPRIVTRGIYPNPPHSESSRSLNTPNTPSSERSWATADDLRLISALPPRPALHTSGITPSRGLTIIRHADAGRVRPNPHRSASSGMPRSGSDIEDVEEVNERGEVHLPPTYGELYGM